MADRDLGIKYNPGQADDPFTADNDYTTDLRGKNPLYDPRVIADLRAHYNELGHNVQGMTDEEIVDEFCLIKLKALTLWVAQSVCMSQPN